MKNSREITLTHPRLIKIRQNLRDLIFEEYTKRSIAIIQKKRKLDYKTQEEEWDELQKQLKELEKAFKNSIIVCKSGVCGRKGDRVYRPEDGGWFCVSHSKKLDRAHYLEDQVKKHFTFDQMERFLSRYGAYLARNSTNILTESLLADPSIPIQAQQELVELIEYYGGYDPSEIYLNAEPKLIKLFKSEFKDL